MGKALEWLGADGCRQVAEAILDNIDTARSNGSELWAACPFHAEKSAGGAFSYNWEKDIAKCFSCGASSDLIGIYCALQGYDQDSSAGFREFRDEYAPDAPAMEPRTRTAPKKQGWAPRVTTAAPAKWRQRAEVFVQHSVERLEAAPEVQAQLQAWGITMETARACRFGWNDKDKAVPRSSWGLDELPNPQTGRPKKIWLPEGLVMPMYAEGRVVKLKIRRPQAQTSWGADLRYWEVPGGENGRFHVYGRPDWNAWVLVETERDAALIWQSVRKNRVGAMGLGGAAKRPNADVEPILRRADVILVALDADQAGAENFWNFWRREFPAAIRWPAPPSMGKDVGDAAPAGLDVAGWVSSGLPSHARKRLNRECETAQAARPRQVQVEVGEDGLTGEVAEFVGLLRQYPLRVDPHYEQVLANSNWSGANRENWAIVRRADWLFERDDVREFLCYCPADGPISKGRSLDIGVRDYLEEQRIIRGEA
jgi:hypothetical protein